ncbi:MAG TPA: hypothetical protein VI819_04860 [Patescibacteria group bacterium]|nr:hypothetical protein [Patescibacteria group bacterium]
MDFEDFDVSKKLPHIRAKNWQVIFWGGIVVGLIALNIFVILYGRSKRASQQVYSPTQEGSETRGNNIVTGIQVDAAEPEQVVTGFLAALNSTDVLQGKEFISRKTNPDALLFFIVDESKYRNFTYYILGAKVDRDKTVAEVSAEITLGSLKEFHTFTLFLEDSYWKIVDDKIISGK